MILLTIPKDIVQDGTATPRTGHAVCARMSGGSGSGAVASGRGRPYNRRAHLRTHGPHDLLSPIRTMWGQRHAGTACQSGGVMTEADRMAVETALQNNPLAIAEAEGCLRKGIMILSKEIGLTATRNIMIGILGRLEGEMPERRLH
jgi:hypothetical protein